MQKVVLLVVCAAAIGLPSSLCDLCFVPKINNGAIKIRKTIRKIDWLRFRYVNKTVYEKVKPGSSPSLDSSLVISCDNGYSSNEKGENFVSISCVKGKWTPKPVCKKNVICEDPPKPDGALLTYLPPSKSKADLSESPLGQLEDPSPETLPIPADPKESKNVAVPSGFHMIGTRLIYGCKSKYYKIVGSRIRTCQEDGKWSGISASCVLICGRSHSKRTPFIAYGDATDIGQWPWQAALYEYFPLLDKWTFKCGGALINEDWIITAAHCVTYSRSRTPLPPEELKVYLGKYFLDNIIDKYIQEKKVITVRVPRSYNYTEFDSDIALLQLETPVKLTSRVQPICLPTKVTTDHNLVEGIKGVVTGWGRNENNTLSDTLQQAVLPVVSNPNCIRGFQKANLSLLVTKNMFCAGYDSGKPDTCSGDSGGPVVFKDPSSKERNWVLEGIVSWGSPHGCTSPDQYGVYTTVSNFLDFIYSNI